MTRRASTLADSARAMALLSDQLVRAVHAGRQDRIADLIEQASRMRPPHPFEPLTVLAICLAAQVDPRVDLGERIGWVESLDPTPLEAVA
jgi:hypothetical protein